MTRIETLIPNNQENALGLSLSAEELKQFKEQGYLGPYTIFNADEAKDVFERCFAYPRLFLPWIKGRHAVVKEMADTAMNPKIVKRASAILGEDVLLSGSMMIRQNAAGRHPIHVDLEHVEWEGITIWIAMRNVVRGSSFSIIPGSHLFNVSPQELSHTASLNASDDDAVLEAAKKINPASKLLYLDITDGQFIIFSGKLWHGTQNSTSTQRGSIVLQYTRPENKVKIAETYNFPYNTWSKKMPLCMLVHGQDRHHVNKLVDIRRISKSKSYLQGLFLNLPANLMRNMKQLM